MKIDKFNENVDDRSENEKKLEVIFIEILQSELEMESVPYTDDEIISYNSMKKASKEIIEYLKTKGLLLCLDAKNIIFKFPIQDKYFFSYSNNISFILFSSSIYL